MNNNLDWVHHDSKTFDEEKFMEDVERKYIEKHTVHIKAYTQKYVDKLNKQITQLTNNWNELEEWLWKELEEGVKQNFKEHNFNFITISVEDVLDKMKEIKENNK